MNTNRIITNSRVAFITSTTVLLSAVVLYVLFEPVISRSQVPSPQTFEITQTILGEISFAAAVQDVTMVGSINGLTGGFATGTTQAVVKTNDPDGYTMTIEFPFAGTSAMQGDTTSSFINNYITGTPLIPDYTFSNPAPGGASVMAYSVSASTTAELVTAFRNNGSVCNNDTGGDVDGRCWMNASTTPQAIIDSTITGATPNGATTTIRFKVAVPDSPSPALDADTYTATATLTATNNI